MSAIPSAFLIDGEGVIRKASLGGFDVETAVAELVKENLNRGTDAPIDTPSDTPEGAHNVDPNAKEIIKAAVAAHGGLENLEAVKNIVMESHSFEHLPDGRMQDEGKTKAYLYPDKFRTDWHSHNQRMSLIFDGESVFSIEDGKVEPLPPEAAKHYTDRHENRDFRELIWPLTDLLHDDISVEYVGTEAVKGVPASVLLVKEPSGKASRFFISEETHLVVKVHYTTKFGKEMQDVERYLGDYRDVGGIKIAHHSATKTFEYRETLITDITLNAEVDEVLFRPTE